MKNLDTRILLTFMLVVMFFAGGMLLNYFASREQVTLGEKEQASDVKLIEYVKSKADNFSQSAKVLFDFGKIALGALLTMLSGVKAPTTAPTIAPQDAVPRRAFDE
ncbi:MAG TPA: hypothetical protein VNN25_02955 [Thermoanaerobaculia bacterium]|nr:hypothetical protein [Thermoanaerobaculia bacterium]